MDREDADRLLQDGDPMRDAEALSMRLLAIDEAERIRDVLNEADIPCQLRLVRPGEVRSGPDGGDGLLLSEYSVLRPSWNVFVPAGELPRARALCEERLRTDLDGRVDAAAVAGNESTPPPPVPLIILPWDEAWTLVERLSLRGIRAAVGAPPEGPLEEQAVPVLVLPEDVERARTFIPGEAAGP
jgi:hypothetical protein